MDGWIIKQAESKFLTFKPIFVLYPYKKVLINSFNLICCLETVVFNIGYKTSSKWFWSEIFNIV